LPPQPENLGYDYFPLFVGKYKIYQAQAIHYNLDGTTDTLEYQLKEVIADSSTIGNEISYRLNRYHRDNEDQPWTIDSVWSARRNTYQAIMVEHNVPIIKLSFPIKEDKRWDGNAMNTKEFDEFKMINVGESYMLDGTEYVNSLEMFKEDLLDPLQITRDNYHLEVFSKGIGLVYKLDIDKKYCNPVDCPEPGIILEGKVIEQKILEFGKVE
jgi:hypothetical protein